GAQRDVRLGDLPHLDRGLDAGGDAALLEEVLQGQAVHDRAEHAHVVGAAAVHAALGQLRAAEEVAAADDDRALDALGDPLGDLRGDAGDDVGVDADGTAAEGLARELQEDTSS